MLPAIRATGFILTATLLLPVMASAQGHLRKCAGAVAPAVLDAQGKLLAWYQPEKNLGYDQVLRAGLGFHRAQSAARHAPWHRSARFI